MSYTYNAKTTIDWYSIIFHKIRINTLEWRDFQELDTKWKAILYTFYATITSDIPEKHSCY